MPRREGQRYGRRTKAELLGDGQPQRERGEGTFVDVVVHGKKLVRAYKLVRRANGVLVKVSGTGKDRAEARARLNANHAAFLIRNASGTGQPPVRRAARAASSGSAAPTLADLALDLNRPHYARRSYSPVAERPTLQGSESFCFDFVSALWSQ